MLHLTSRSINAFENECLALILSWRHSGFQVYVGPKLLPGEEDPTENLARYVIRASFSQESMTYLQEESKILYQSKDGAWRL